MFTDWVQWLRVNAVLLPGVTTLARVVARVREEATDDLYATLAGLPGAHQRVALEHLVVMPCGARYSDLERWRKSPAKPSGRDLEKALNRTAEIGGVGVGALNLDALVPRRVVDLARYGMAARAQALRRHGTERRLAHAPGDRRLAGGQVDRRLPGAAGLADDYQAARQGRGSRRRGTGPP